MSIQTKRANFEITPDQEARLLALKEVLQAASLKEVVLRTSTVMLVLARALAGGKRLYLGESSATAKRLIIPELESVEEDWHWLVARPHPWRKQLWVKGRKLLAAQVWFDKNNNQLSKKQAAQNWNLPLEAITEITRYCKDNAALIALETQEERRRLLDAGVQLAPVA